VKVGSAVAVGVAAVADCSNPEQVAEPVLD
jgi:hypothetical protein